VTVLRFVLSTSHVLDVVAIAFFVPHDLMDGTQWGVLAIVVEAMLKFSIFALSVALVDVAAVSRPHRFLLRLARRSTPGTAFVRGWLTSSWMVGSLLCASRLDRLRECRLDV
jgi:hypothetical protein